MSRRALLGALACMVVTGAASGQVNVTTQHNDIARTGQNLSETKLTPANVNSTSFGKLFAHTVDGHVYAQPLYVSGLAMGAGTAQAGTTHNTVFIATQHDSVYAFDADSNTGANGTPLWKITLLDAAHGAAVGATPVPNWDLSTGDIVPEVGITATPVIDLSTKTMYVVGKTKENGTYVQRLHAIDITTGAEKYGGPRALAAHVAGTGSGSSGGFLKFDPLWENNRPGLLLLDGIVYMGFAAHGDNGPWHGWILSYNAATLAQTGAFCTTSNGSGSGVWMSGAGLAADTYNPAANTSPGGRMFIATGNGSFSATGPPYTGSMNYGDDLVRLNLKNGAMQVGDSFTPGNQASLNSGDIDLGAGGVLLLPDQSSGGHTRLLVQGGKEGRVYVADRDALGGYNTTADNLVESFSGEVGGLYSTPAYWNNRVYFWGANSYLKAFSLTSGKLSTAPVASANISSSFPGATPSISANGTSGGIVWALQTSGFGSSSPAILWAFDATSLTLLYGSNENATRDAAGPSVKFAVPTIANGKVFVGTATQVDVYGSLGNPQQTAAPTLSPAGGSFTGTLSVTMTSSTTGASIYYTTNGTTPTASSTKYNGAITVNTTETVKAIATTAGDSQSAVTSGAYTLQSQTAAPTISPATGTYAGPLTVTITATTSGATVYYTTNGTTPTTASTKYTASFTVSSTTTVKAIATASGFTTSSVATSLITISATQATTTVFGFGSGFVSTGMQFNGHARLNKTRLQLTDSATTFEGASAYWAQMVNVQAFTNDFTFQLSSPYADGFTFTIQRAAVSAIGPSAGGLGYGAATSGGTGGIAHSVAVKFDFYNNAGEGTNSTGLYINGASPTIPAITLGGGVNLLSGHAFKVHMTYDGSILHMTITDTTNTTQTFTSSWPVNIPSIVGGNTAYVGFTGGTGGHTAIQEILSWTYALPVTKTPVVYATTGLTAVSSGPLFQTLSYTGFPDGTGTILQAAKTGDYVTFTVNVAAAGLYDVKLSCKKYNTRGIAKLAIDGTTVGAALDQYAASDSYATFDFGTYNFASIGKYAFKFSIAGKNPASSGYTFSFDDITLTPQ